MPRLFFHRYFCHVKYKILSLFILLLAGHSAFAQQDIIVKGKVSGGDGEHVFYDLMIVNRRMRTGTFANTDGSFTARVQRNDTLHIGAGVHVTRQGGRSIDLNANIVDYGEAPVDTGDSPYRGRVVGKTDNPYALMFDASFHF